MIKHWFENMKYNSYNLNMKKIECFEPEIVHVWFKEGTTYDTLYEDGVVRRYDILDSAKDYPPFNKLKNRKLFLRGRVVTYSIIWNSEIDISSWAAYDFGTDVTNEYNDLEKYLVGYKLKCARINHKVSQEVLAKRTGIDQATISKIEKGGMNPSVKTIMKIVKALNAKIKLTIK